MATIETGWEFHQNEQTDVEGLGCTSHGNIVKIGSKNMSTQESRGQVESFYLSRKKKVCIRERFKDVFCNIQIKFVLDKHGDS